MKNSLIERMLYITLAIVFLGQMLVTGVLLHQNKQGREQTKILMQQVESLAKVSKDQGEILTQLKTLNETQGKTVTEINKSLSCILVFFTTPGRTNYYLSDLTTCTITNVNTGKTELLPLPQAAPSAQAPAHGGSQQGSPSASNGGNNDDADDDGGNTPPPTSNPSVLEHVIDNTTDFTCGLIHLLCR